MALILIFFGIAPSTVTIWPIGAIPNPFWSLLGSTAFWTSFTNEVAGTPPWELVIISFTVPPPFHIGTTLHPPTPAKDLTLFW